MHWFESEHASNHWPQNHFNGNKRCSRFARHDDDGDGVRSHAAMPHHGNRLGRNIGELHTAHAIENIAHHATGARSRAVNEDHEVSANELIFNCGGQGACISG
ncbi:unannotated protein [freshwater metagenome]|uniref:Unannotated protein n=1 Tax=freshwater metagenome TaxID=449393 RepID=A0A6J6BQ47_9ZZZZ